MQKIKDYEYGFYYISKILKNKLKSLLQFLSIPIDFLLYKNYISSLREYYPQKLERLKGIADNLGIDTKKLLKLAIIIRHFIKGGCTTSCVLSNATSDNKIYLSWNLDIVRLAKFLFHNFLIYVEEVLNYNKYISWGIPGISGFGLLNDKGVGCVISAVGMGDGGGEGLFDVELNNLAMERCSNIEEVVELFRVTPKYSFSGYTAGILLNFNFIFADNKDNGVLIEHSKNYIEFTYAKDYDGVLAEANHHQFLDRGLSKSPTPNEQKAIAGSYCRVGRMWELLNEHKGKIDFNLISKITADHQVATKYLEGYNYEKPVDDATICCHYWNIPTYLKKVNFKKLFDAYFMGETIMAFIINLKDYILYVCYGKPCKSAYLPIYCKQLLGIDKTNVVDQISTSKTLISKIRNSTRINEFIRKRTIFINKLFGKVFNLFVRKLIIFIITILEKLIRVR